MAGMGKGVAFEPAKGWWVRALDISVIIKTGACADVMGCPEREESGEIEGFFVDVHNIRAQSAHQRTKRGVVMEVMFAIEAHR